METLARPAPPEHLYAGRSCPRCGCPLEAAGWRVCPRCRQELDPCTGCSACGRCRK